MVKISDNINIESIEVQNKINKLINNDYLEPKNNIILGIDPYNLILGRENKIKDIIAGSNINVKNNGGNYIISSKASASENIINTPFFSLSSLGNAIDGTQTNNFFGVNTSISSDGNVIAVSLINDGTAKIYAWNGTSWIQRGTTFS